MKPISQQEPPIITEFQPSPWFLTLKYEQPATYQQALKKNSKKNQNFEIRDLEKTKVKQKAKTLLFIDYC